MRGSEVLRHRPRHSLPPLPLNAPPPPAHLPWRRVESFCFRILFYLRRFRNEVDAVQRAYLNNVSPTETSRQKQEKHFGERKIPYTQIIKIKNGENGISVSPVRVHPLPSPPLPRSSPPSPPPPLPLFSFPYTPPFPSPARPSHTVSLHFFHLLPCLLAA